MQSHHRNAVRPCAQPSQPWKCGRQNDNDQISDLETSDPTLYIWQLVSRAGQSRLIIVIASHRRREKESRRIASLNQCMGFILRDGSKNWGTKYAYLYVTSIVHRNPRGFSLNPWHFYDVSSWTETLNAHQSLVYISQLSFDAVVWLMGVLKRCRR